MLCPQCLNNLGLCSIYMYILSDVHELNIVVWYIWVHLFNILSISFSAFIKNCVILWPWTKVLRSKNNNLKLNARSHNRFHICQHYLHVYFKYIFHVQGELEKLKNNIKSLKEGGTEETEDEVRYIFLFVNVVFNNAKNSSNFIVWEPWFIRGQTHEMTSQKFRVFKLQANGGNCFNIFLNLSLAGQLKTLKNTLLRRLMYLNKKKRWKTRFANVKANKSKLFTCLIRELFRFYYTLAHGNFFVFITNDFIPCIYKYTGNA